MILKKPAINTGDPRSVTGHVVSGAVASAIVAGAINYKKFQDGSIEKQHAVRDTVKKTAQGGIATGAAISAANHLGTGNWFQALSSISIGMAGLYAVEVVDNQLEQMALEAEDMADSHIESPPDDLETTTEVMENEG